MKTVNILAVTFLCASVSDAGDWSRFRGPDGSGVIQGPELPASWSSKSNLKWRTPLPGKGVSSPIVVGNRVYLTCYTGYGLDPEKPGKVDELVRHLIAFDRLTGEEVWRTSVKSMAEEDPYKGFITQHGYASASPVSDGEHVFVIFGKSGLFAFDQSGKQVWRTELGTKSDPARWGDSASPILVGDTLVVDAGVLGNHVVGIDKKTGDKRWSIEDPSFTNSWATPSVLRVDGKTQVLVHVPKKVMALEPKSGDVIWSATSPLNDATCGGIVTKGERAYLMGSREGHGMAIDCTGSGDVSESHVKWNKRIRSGIATPVVVGENMYWSSGGIFFAADLKTGEYKYRERLPRLGESAGGFPNGDYSSPIAVGNKIVQFTRNGESYVIEAGDEFKIASHNAPFEDDDSAFSATPAASNGELFMRSESFLYCIAGK
ncbi:MAG: PQQ-binding-like beta-propeller repeat protein [Phycisphaerae bacterium]